MSAGCFGLCLDLSGVTLVAQATCRWVRLLILLVPVVMACLMVACMRLMIGLGRLRVVVECVSCCRRWASVNGLVGAIPRALNILLVMANLRLSIDICVLLVVMRLLLI